MSGIKVSQEVQRYVTPYELLPGTVVAYGDNLYMIISDPMDLTSPGGKKTKDSYVVNLETGYLCTLEGEAKVSVVEIHGSAVRVQQSNLREYLQEYFQGDADCGEEEE